MPLQVLVGCAASSMPGVLRSRIVQTADDGLDACVLVPMVGDAAAVSRRLAPSCVRGVRVSTLGGYLDSLWRAYGDGRQLASSAQRAVVLEDIVSTTDPGCLGDVASTPGFRTMLSVLVREQAETPAAGGLKETLPCDIRAKLTEYALAYDAALRVRGLVERATAYRMLANLCGRLELPSLLMACGFVEFTPAQESFLVAAASVSDVILALPFSPQVPATEAAAPLLARLQDAGAAVEAVRGSTVLGGSELQRIACALGSRPEAPIVPQGEVVISEAAGRHGEAARIACEVQDALADGIPPREILVVHPGLASHVRMLRAAFAEAEIPVEWDTQVRFSHSGLGRAVLALLALAAGEGDREVWMQLMRSPYSPAAATPLDELDARVRRSGKLGADAVDALTSWVDGEASSFLHDGLAACAGLTEEGSVDRWQRLSTRMLAQAHGKAVNLQYEALMDSAAARALIEAVTAVHGSSRSSPAMLSSALEVAVIPFMSAGQEQCVHVTSMDRVRSRRFQCVIVGGLVQGEFPRSADSSSSISPDEGTASSSHKDETAQQRLLFYRAVTRASKRLVLSRRTHDDAGRPLPPSIFLEEVMDLYHADGGEERGEYGPPRRVLGPAAWALDAGAPVTSRRAARTSALSGAAHGKGSPGGGRPGGHRRTSEPLAIEMLESLASREVFSVSDIETYLECPHRWFTEGVIRPHKLDIAADASAIGRFAHEVLATFYKRFKERTGHKRLEPDLADTAMSLHEEIVDELLPSVHANTAAEAAGLRAAVRHTQQILMQDAVFLPGFWPIHTEWSFGLGEGGEPEAFDGFSLAGRIDRIDTDGKRAVVTDYKLGQLGSGHGKERFERNGLVQLPLYAAVVARRLGLRIAGGVYRSISKGTVRGFVSKDLAEGFTRTDIVSDDEVERLIDAAVARASEAVDGIRAGRIEPDTPANGCPRYCPARSYCEAWRPGRAGSR